MARLFGTDGVRGIANAHLNAELAYKLGRAAAQYFGREVKSPKIIIGRDTRLSGTMLESASRQVSAVRAAMPIFWASSLHRLFPI